jgi:hypothetical protein
MESILMTIIAPTVIQCPVFLALIAGAVVGIIALVRNNKIAGALAFCGFVVLVVLLFLQILSGLLPTLMIEQGMRYQEIGALSMGVSCVFSVLKTVGLLAVIGALAAYAFQARAEEAQTGRGDAFP